MFPNENLVYPVVFEDFSWSCRTRPRTCCWYCSVRSTTTLFRNPQESEHLKLVRVTQPSRRNATFWDKVAGPLPGSRVSRAGNVHWWTPVATDGLRTNLICRSWVAPAGSLVNQFIRSPAEIQWRGKKTLLRFSWNDFDNRFCSLSLASFARW